MELVCLILETLSIVGVIGWLIDMLERPKVVKRLAARSTMLNGIKKSETEWEIKNPPKVNGDSR